MKQQSRFSRARLALIAGLIGLAAATSAYACRDKVVLVHGNTASPSSWDNTYNKLIASGWKATDIVRPNWGSKTCAACNDHSGSELDVVKSAINNAINSSCTGKIDVIGHSMGVTLAALAITQLGKSSKVDSFVGVAGALRGLNSCGTYPFNVASTTCGAWGLSKKSKTMNAIVNKRFASRMYSIKSYNDAVVCLGGWAFCYVDGTHTSNIWYQNASYDYNTLGHFGLQTSTAQKQYELIR